jgi:hypothetical protein
MKVVRLGRREENPLHPPLAEEPGEPRVRAGIEGPEDVGHGLPQVLEGAGAASQRAQHVDQDHLRSMREKCSRKNGFITTRL